MSELLLSDWPSHALVLGRLSLTTSEARPQLPKGPRQLQGRAHWALGSTAQNSVCEETKPVATESSVLVSKVTKTHKR